MNFTLWLALVMVFLEVSGAAAAGVSETMRFSQSSSSMEIEQSVVRGERDFFYLTAKVGQKMTVKLSSLENNAVLQIYQPGFEVSANKEGGREVKGKCLPGAGETDDATAWKGGLPASGQYLLVVGATRGNATYRLKVEIR